MSLRPLLLLLVACGTAPSEDEVTWHRDVRPVVERSCVGCHTEHGIAPFSLTDDPAAWVDGAPSWAPLIVHAVQTRAMPPWPAADDCHPIEDAERLTDDEIARFVAWGAAGFPEGDRADFVAIDQPAFVDPGPADLVLDAGADHTPSSLLPDDYWCLPVGDVFDADTLIRAIDVRAGHPDIVHHAVAFLVPAEGLADVAEADAATEGPGYPCFGGPVPDQGVAVEHLHAWVPGALPEVLPDGDARRLTAGSRIVLQMHYNLLGLPEGAPVPSDRSAVALWRFHGEPLGLVTTLGLLNQKIPIPAGDPEVTHTRGFSLHTPTLVVGVAGHMHQLGTHIRADVVHPDGTRDCLLDIPDWDFAWQRTYWFPKGDPYTLGRRDVVETTCVYDNSAGNQPIVDGVRIAPQDRASGEGTLDEMCLVYTLVRFGGALGGSEGCGPFQACFGLCAESDGACLATCLEGSANDCGVCALGGLGACGDVTCGEARDALATCLDACTDGASAAKCLAGPCRPRSEDYLGCLDPDIRAGVCDPFLSACGLTFGE